MGIMTADDLEGWTSDWEDDVSPHPNFGKVARWHGAGLQPEVPTHTCGGCIDCSLLQKPARCLTAVVASLYTTPHHTTPQELYLERPLVQIADDVRALRKTYDTVAEDLFGSKRRVSTMFAQRMD